MLEKTFYIITFDSTHLAIGTEKFLLATEVVEMVPTPREISASCGLSIKISPNHFESALQALASRPKAGMHLYHMVRESGQKVVTPLEWRD